MLDTHEPKVVNGPEIMSKFLGESEQKMRELFKDAENDMAAEKREAAAAAAARGESPPEEGGGSEEEEEGEEDKPEEMELRFEAKGDADGAGAAGGNKIWESLLGQMKVRLALLFTTLVCSQNTVQFVTPRIFHVTNLTPPGSANPR
jgi:hypothetical protein